MFLKRGTLSSVHFLRKSKSLAKHMQHGNPLSCSIVEINMLDLVGLHVEWCWKAISIMHVSSVSKTYLFFFKGMNNV